MEHGLIVAVMVHQLRIMA